MTPALAFFYGGMVRRKNILSTLNLSLITMGLISLQWVLFGFTLAFGPSVGGFIGGLDYLGFAGVGSAPSDTYGTTLPFIAFAAYQMTFAVITPALITGSFVERVRFKTYIIFALLWSTLVYAPGGALGLGGGRLFLRHGRPGLRWRHRGAYYGWLCGVGLCPSDSCPPWVR
jgi:Amt family ammonium transporter